MQDRKPRKKKNGLKLKRFTYYSFNYKRLCNFLSDMSLVLPRGIRLGGAGGGVLPMIAYTGMLRSKGVSFSSFRYLKG